MDADHPDIAAAVEGTPHDPAGLGGGVRDAGASISNLIDTVLSRQGVLRILTMVDNMATLTGHMGGMAAVGESSAQAMQAEMAKLAAWAKPELAVLIAWIKAEFAKPPAVAHPAVGFFRRPPLPVYPPAPAPAADEFAASPTFMSHYNNTSAELNQIKSIVMAEAALLQTIATAVTTLVNHPVISPDQAAALTASLKASAAKLEAAVNAAPHPS